MAGLGDIVQKAFYLGVGLASYASEKATGTLAQLRVQAQKLADEMVARGEMTTEDARRFVEDMVNQAQQQQSVSSDGNQTPSEPRRIEILFEDEESTQTEKKPEDVDDMRRKVQALQDELRRLQNP